MITGTVRPAFMWTLRILASHSRKRLEAFTFSCDAFASFRALTRTVLYVACRPRVTLRAFAFATGEVADTIPRAVTRTPPEIANLPHERISALARRLDTIANTLPIAIAVH